MSLYVSNLLDFRELTENIRSAEELDRALTQAFSAIEYSLVPPEA